MKRRGRPRPGRSPVSWVRRRMRSAVDVATVRRWTSEWRRLGHRIAFIPTMGAIHAGHVSLIRRARTSADCVVASIFVNPLQFGPGEDYQGYPRPAGRDRLILRREGVDLLWQPRVVDLYPEPDRTRVRVQELDQVMEGTSRPGHFEGVATVVLKLLNVVGPDVVWLGQKDAQQARLIEQMCRDLHLEVTVRRAPTMREPDGLAWSSRNLYLKPGERAQAVALSRGLAVALHALRNGERSAARLKAAVRRVWREYPKVKEDYVEVADAKSLEPLRRVRGRVLVAVAARVGKARLIDNFEWEAR